MGRDRSYIETGMRVEDEADFGDFGDGGGVEVLKRMRFGIVGGWIFNVLLASYFECVLYLNKGNRVTDPG